MSHSPYLDFNRDLDVLHQIVDDYQEAKERAQLFAVAHLVQSQYRPIIAQKQMALAS